MKILMQWKSFVIHEQNIKWLKDVFNTNKINLYCDDFKQYNNRVES